MRNQFVITGHTDTSAGPVPHITYGGGELRAPVKLDFSRPQARWQGQQRYRPLVRRGRYVHALPGGGEILGSAVV